MNEAEVSQDNEGLNVGLSRIWWGGPNFEFASLILNKDRGVIGVKSDSTDTWRTAVYETRTYGGVRGALRQLTTGGAVYSISGSFFFIF